MKGLRAGISLGALLLVLLFGIAYMAFGVLGINPLKEHIQAKMLLTNSGGLAPNSPILLTGVEVGNVTSVQKSDAGVEVEFRIDDAYKIPVASNVRVENLSALGEPYIEFEPTTRAGPYLADGQLVETRSIQQPTSIPEVSARVVELMGQFDPKTVSSIIGTFATGLEGTESVVPALERSTKLLAATILSRATSTNQLLTDLQSIGADMSWLGPALRDSGPQFANFGVVMDSVINQAWPAIAYGDTPAMYNTGDGLVPFLAKLTKFVNKIGPSTAELAPVVQPLVSDVLRAVPRFDISSLISQAVNTVGDDGAIHFQINIK